MLRNISNFNSSHNNKNESCASVALPKHTVFKESDAHWLAAGDDYTDSSTYGKEQEKEKKKVRDGDREMKRRGLLPMRVCKAAVM